LRCLDFANNADHTPRPSLAMGAGVNARKTMTSGKRFITALVATRNPNGLCEDMRALSRGGGTI
jgi:hypothetical protein